MNIRFSQLILLFLFLSGSLNFLNNFLYENKPQLSIKHLESRPLLTPNIPHEPGIPETISIPILSLSASVESVGLDTQKKMDVPKDPANVAWYNPGFKPGEKGNSVINGHVDSPTGPAVFFRLKELKTGDKIAVIDNQNHKYNFVVKDKKSFPFNQVPLNEIFGPSDRPLLNLITCDGIFDRKSKNYTLRTIIYSEMLP